MMDIGTAEWSAWCTKQHEEVNQGYGGLPYSFHLEAVYAQVEAFKHLVKTNELSIVSAAAWAHDILEDTNNTFNDLRVAHSQAYCSRYNSEKVAEVVYCVTDEKGRNRKERKNDKYYKELTNNKLALFVKLCDLIANTMYSRLSGSSMYKKYKKEYPEFKKKTYNPRFGEMYSYLESL